MKKKGHLEFEFGMNVAISETSDLLGFPHMTTSRIYREWSKKETKYPQISKSYWQEGNSNRTCTSKLMLIVSSEYLHLSELMVP